MPQHDDLEQRRRSPAWLRAFADQDLHALTHRMRRLFWEGATSVRQEWLLDVCFSELEYRHRRAIRNRTMDACVCELCVGPFDLFDAEEELY